MPPTLLLLLASPLIASALTVMAREFTTTFLPTSLLLASPPAKKPFEGALMLFMGAPVRRMSPCPELGKLHRFGLLVPAS